MNNIKFLTFGLLVSSSALFAQIQEERLILDRKRVPEVKKIEKKKTSVETVKNYPPEEKSAVPVEYKITNVPAVSDFKTSTIQGEDISPKFDSDFNKNYFRAGYGNYGKFLADGNLSRTLENNIEVGANVHFISTTGLKNDYAWSSAQHQGSIGAFLTSYGEKGKFNLDAEYQRNNYNYYGIYAMQPLANIDLNQKNNQFGVNGYYDFYDNNILNDASVKTSYLSDRFDAKEKNFLGKLNLSKHAVELPWENITMNADLGLGIQNIYSRFELLNQNQSQFFNLDATPKIIFFKDKSYLMIGSGISYLNSKYSSLALFNEKGNSGVYWFPKAEALFAASDLFKFYAGIDGGLQLNSYGSMLQENPFLVSDQMLRPTETKYKFYFGMKGDVNEDFKYDFNAGFSRVNNILFYKANDLFDYIYTLNRSPYNFANTFSAVYDDGNISTVNGNVQYFPLANLALEAEFNLAQYKLQNFDKILNRPMLKGSIGAQYTMLDKKLHLGFKGFVMSQRTTNSFSINNSASFPLNYVSAENTNDSVSAYADFNLSAEYKIHKNFSIFAIGNNLMNQKYEIYKGYKVLGAQILGGVKISF